jgi:uncharacterized protein YgiM (DUF1202 family)
MVKAQTNFIPVQNGFQFPNYFELDFPVKMQLPLVGKVDLNQVVYGLCGGMCFAALDFYHANKSRPDYVKREEIDRKLFTYLCERQLESLQVSVLVKIIDWMLREDKELSERMNRSELPRLKRSLDKGEPQVLCLIRTQGFGNPTMNHQVLAIGYTIDDSGQTLISLYDPNHPGKEPEICVKPERPVMRLQQSTGEALRGFFIVPYRVRKNIPLPPREMPLSFSLEAADEPPFRLRWPVDSRRVNQKFGENPNLYRAFKQDGHEGLDLFAPTGANIYACFEGEVYEAQSRGEYGIQVRIKHQSNGVEFRTIYAHLQKTLVKVGQKVNAGDLIGLSDNTGNSFGSHLHLTLKIKGAKTKGYPDEIVDPWPYMEGSNVPVDIPPASPSGILVYTSSQLNLRRSPSINGDLLASLPAGEALPVLGVASEIEAKIGKQDQWLQVQTASGTVGFVAAWLVEDASKVAFPPSGLVVYPTGEVNLRSGPGTGFVALGKVQSADPLEVLGDADTARTKLGKDGQWIQVQTQAGQRGFIAAWLVHSTGQVPATSGLTVFPTGTINVRAMASTDSNILTIVTAGDALTVLGDAATARADIGQQGKWLNVQTPGKFVGYVAAWFTKLPGEVPPGGNGSTPPPPPASTLTVTPTADVNIRAQPSQNSMRLHGALRGETLTVIDSDINDARAKVGKQDMWLYVEKSNGTRGWVAAWFLNI